MRVEYPTSSPAVVANDNSILRRLKGEIDYWHLLFLRVVANDNSILRRLKGIPI